MSKKTRTGGPAYPVASDCYSVINEGMDLRDYLAGQAITGMLANEAGYGTMEWDIMADCAYNLASHMIKRRDGKGWDGQADQA